MHATVATIQERVQADASRFLPVQLTPVTVYSSQQAPPVTYQQQASTYLAQPQFSSTTPMQQQPQQSSFNRPAWQQQPDTSLYPFYQDPMQAAIYHQQAASVPQQAALYQLQVSPEELSRLLGPTSATPLNVG